MTRHIAGTCAAILVCATSALTAAPIEVSDTTLGNGLRVVVYENHTAPTASVQVWYRVGSYFEPGGYTGMSHLLEHMMFQGTKKYGSGKYSDLIEAQGGRENAFTSDNYTVYWAELASDRYELELGLEADRMANLLLDSVEFERERNVVMEERRLGENTPYNSLWQEFSATAYMTHTYRNPVIGWMGDLENLKRSDLLRHYQTYYTPSNAVLVVAGDVQPHKVFSQAVKYFGAIKAHPVPAWRPTELPQQGERRFVIRKDISTPALMLGYHVPGTDNPDFYAFELLEGLLMRGMTSRLYARLVYQGGKAMSIWGGNDAEGSLGLFYFFALPRTPGLQDTLEQMIYAELESLKTTPVRDSELLRVKNQVVSDFVYRQDDARGVGHGIGQSLTMHGSLDYLNTYPDRVSAVTREDIMRVAAKYFKDDNRTVGRVVPTGVTPPGAKMTGRGER